VTDAVVRSWLEKHRNLKKDGLTATQVTTIVSRSLSINMSEKDTEQRIIMLFSDYKSLLRLKGISWIVKDNPKIAIGHITECLKPAVFRKRIKDDLKLSHTELRKDFLLFMKHVIARAEIYAYHEETDAAATLNERASSESKQCPESGGAGKGPGTRSGSASVKGGKPPSPGKTKNAPDCLNPACSLKHYLKDCQNTTAARKDELYAELSGRRKQNGEQRTTLQEAAKSASYILPKASTPANLSASGGGAKVKCASALPPAGRLKISFKSTP
jgi:hypothetical protein